MTTRFFKILTLFMVCLVINCAGNLSSNMGGSEAGNPPMPSQRALQGSVPKPDSGCEADTIVATPSSDEEALSSVIQDDCSFSINLNIGESYQISFELSGEPVGLLTFESTATIFENSFFVVVEGDTPITLGLVTLSDQTATTQTIPQTQNDQDDDGIPDSEDSDANGDGIIDQSQEDCDLDGVPDIFDNNITSCLTGNSTSGTGETPIAHILEVTPHNNDGILLLSTAVKLDAKVAVRFDCEIDPASVNSNSFRVTNLLNQSILCSYTFSHQGEVVSCNHSDDLFSVLTNYTATIEGVACLDAEAGDATTWSWKTKGLPGL